MPVRFLALVLAAVALTPSGAFGTALHWCRTMGAVRASCCCHRQGDAERSAGSQLKMDCCEIRSASDRSAPAIVAANLEPPIATAESASVFAVEPAPLVRVVEPVTPWHARGPPARIRLFLQNCSLLI